MQTLPPFRVAPYFRPRIWGFHDLAPWFDFKTAGEPIGEVWLTGDQCLAETGPLAGTALRDVASEHGAALLGSAHDGEEFPLLIKVLFPKEKLSVQVHPDDTMAQKYGAPRGKTECWYALDAEPGAQVALGIKPGAQPEQVRKAIEDAGLEDLLEYVPVSKGDMIFVDAGTVHAILPGSVLLETQQNSDLTYRMYDYGRARELHVDWSMEATRLHTQAGKVRPVPENGGVKLIDQKYFRVDSYILDGARAASVLKRGGVPGVQIWFVNEGELAVSGTGFETFTLSSRQLAIVPASAGDWEVDVQGNAEVIRIVPQ